MSDVEPFEAHLFICTNRRENGECCAAKGSVELRELVKQLCDDPSRGWQGRVRVNASGCLNHCKEGISAVLYPQSEWRLHLTKESAPELIAMLAAVLDARRK
ncbi:MAG: (2Fe-2S) ferredoxin domain-containing protein [Deltaproteobacteria bacterium]|nr:(2Fe-2S) ferredoxin domain-containing protein [Deltaproteobacteria bacterium]